MAADKIFEKYPLLAGFYGYEYDDNRLGELHNEYFNRVIEQPVPEFKAYLRNALHDSYVKDVFYDSKELTISLYDCYLADYAGYFAREMGFTIHDEKLEFPVSLTFSGLKKFEVNSINRNWKILPVNKDKYILEMREFLYDEAIKLESDDISLGMLFWPHSYYVNMLLVEVECNKLTFNDNHRETFVRLFGEENERWFDLYWNERLKGNGLADSQLVDLINDNR